MNDAASGWLAVIAISTTISALVSLAAAVAALRAYKAATSKVEELTVRLEARFDVLERQVAPVLEQASSALVEVRDVMARAKSAERDIRRVVSAIAKTGERAGQAASVLRGELWPLVSIGRDAWGGVRNLLQRRQTKKQATDLKRSQAKRSQDDGESRFVYEGGIDHAPK